jgi:DNA-binding XRE family transcriptional regulator
MQNGKFLRRIAASCWTLASYVDSYNTLGRIDSLRLHENTMPRSSPVSPVADHVKAFREAMSLTTTQLAKMVGTSRQNIENLEGGRVLVPSYIVALADTLGRSTDELLRANHTTSLPQSHARASALTSPINGLSKQALAIAHLFDSIEDRAARTQAYAAVLEAIAQQLRGEH